MKKNKVCLLMVWQLLLTSLFVSGLGEEGSSNELYSLAIEENTVLIYEVKFVNSSINEEEKELYENAISGEQVKWVVSSIVEEEDFWIVNIAKYGGENLDSFTGDFENIVYKTPEILANLIEQGYTTDLNFLPVNASRYIEGLKTFFSDNLSLSCDAEKMQVIRTFTNHSFAYEYNQEGLLTELNFYEFNDLMITIELVEVFLDIFPAIAQVFFSTILAIALVGIVYARDKKKRKKTVNAIYKLLKHSRN